MKKIKFLSQAKYDARKYGSVNVDLDPLMLEVNGDPATGDLHYFINSPAGRRQASESEAERIIGATDGELVKSTRKKLNLNQTQFAEKVGFTDQAYVSKIERGERNLSRSSRKFIESLA